MMNIQQIAKVDANLLPVLLKSFEDQQSFKNASETVIKNINSLINFRDTRSQGLQLLKTFCDQHSVPAAINTTEKTCPEIGWIESLLKIVEQQPELSSLIFTILKTLLVLTSSNSDIHKIIQSKYLQKIIDAATSETIPSVESLQCLEACMKLYAGTSGIYKNKIYEFCSSFIDINDDDRIVQISKCLHLMQQTRGGSVSGGIYKKCWSDFHSQTLGSLEETFGRLLKNVESLKIGKSEKLKLPELKLSSESAAMYSQLLVRFKNLVTIFQVSLLEPFPTTKTIQTSRIIAFVESGISMNQSLLSKKAVTDNSILTALQCQIHKNFLRILQALIMVMQQNIIPHSKAICDLLWRCLKQTSIQNSKQRTNISLRCVAYEIIKMFIEISPNNIFIKSISENLLKEAFIDVTPPNDEICLMVPQPNGNKSNRKKRNQHADKKIGKSKGHVVNIENEQMACYTALDVMNTLLKYDGATLKPVLYKLMQDKILSVAFMITERDSEVGDLYSNSVCRIKLTELIYNMMSHPATSCPAPISFGIELLQKLKNDDFDFNVRRTAAIHLTFSEKLIHNKKESFYFPTDIRDFRDTLKYNAHILKKFSEKAPEEDSVKQNTGIITLEDDDEEQNEESLSEVIAIPDEDQKHETPMEQEEVNVIISDDSSDGDLQIIGNKDKVEQTSEKERIEDAVEPVVVLPAPKRQAKQKSPAANKKVKLADKQNDKLIDEYLADFNDE